MRLRPIACLVSGLTLAIGCLRPGETSDSTCPATLADERTELPRPPAPKCSDWHCPFPVGIVENVHTVTVMLEVSVDARGGGVSARALHQPDRAFAESAVQCASFQPYHPARDDSGDAVAGSCSVAVVFAR